MIDVNNEQALQRWATQFCCTPGELREAVRAIGPCASDVKRYLFGRLLRTCLQRPRDA